MALRSEIFRQRETTPEKDEPWDRSRNDGLLADSSRLEKPDPWSSGIARLAYDFPPLAKELDQKIPHQFHLENFFEQLRRDFFRRRFVGSEPVLAEDIPGAFHRLFERTKCIVEERGILQRQLPFGRASRRMSIRMPLPAQLIKALLKKNGIERQLGLDAEKGEEIPIHLND